MFCAMLRVHNVECAVALIEAFFDERCEHPVFFFLGIEKSANMSRWVQNRTGQPYFFRSHTSPLTEIRLKLEKTLRNRSVVLPIIQFWHCSRDPAGTKWDSRRLVDEVGHRKKDNRALLNADWREDRN